MGFTTRNLHQIATHWVATPDGYGGFTFSSPTEIYCRWDSNDELVRMPGGEQLVPASMVLLKSDIAEGDYLYLGSSEEADPTVVEGASRVMRFKKITDIRNLHVTRVAYL